jgi:hypothetical protein
MKFQRFGVGDKVKYINVDKNEDTKHIQPLSQMDTDKVYTIVDVCVKLKDIGGHKMRMYELAGVNGVIYDIELERKNVIVEAIRGSYV